MLIVCPQCWTKNRFPDERLGEQPSCGRCQAKLLPTYPIALNDQTFDYYLQNTDLPIVVDFWAEWCGPCQMMAPQFAQAAAQMPLVRFVKVDTEQARQVSAQHAIRSIPTLMLFQGGREVARQSGAMRAPQLLAWLKQAIG
ncbi:MAG: thioredoxin TrxC [Pseudomonadota bacterium]|nr:thioredoxin TrxC [Pseudomonadota bacterium]